MSNGFDFTRGKDNLLDSGTDPNSSLDRRLGAASTVAERSVRLDLFFGPSRVELSCPRGGTCLVRVISGAVATVSDCKVAGRGIARAALEVAAAVAARLLAEIMLSSARGLDASTVALLSFFGGARLLELEGLL